MTAVPARDPAGLSAMTDDELLAELRRTFGQVDPDAEARFRRSWQRARSELVRSPGAVPGTAAAGALPRRAEADPGAGPLIDPGRGRGAAWCTRPEPRPGSLDPGRAAPPVAALPDRPAVAAGAEGALRLPLDGRPAGGTAEPPAGAVPPATSDRCVSDWWADGTDRRVPPRHVVGWLLAGALFWGLAILIGVQVAQLLGVLR